MPDTWIDTKACVVVKTYPTPAWNGVEVSCTAAITDKGQWLRLFPIPFRFLESGQQFRKYHWIQLRIKKSSDARLESHNVDPDSIKVAGEPVNTDKKWEERKKIVLPLVSQSYCALKEKRDATGSPTLGIFKPKKITRLVIEAAPTEWNDAEKAKLGQKDLFDVGPVNQLEKIPYKFSYEFICNHDGCNGHQFMCADWEMAQAYRAWSKKYRTGWEGPFRQKFEKQMIELQDTHFYIGTVHQHPANWIIVGLFYPPL